MNKADCILENIRARRSIRRYLDRPVPRELIEKILDAARWAPSAHNRQPWRFAVIERAETKRALAAAMGRRLRQDLERDGVAPSVIENDTARSYERITHAPVVIVVCVTLRDMDVYADTRRKKAEYLMATQSVAMATQNLLLAAYALGLGGCWMCAPLFAPDIVRDVLNLDADWEPQALITLGFPAEEKTRERVALDLRVKFLDADKRG
ncbi:MAG: nitroreductase family protein [Chloroflexi bacterium]|nr:nitroreductase family protein [Chloroflexota bacterium]